MVHREYPTPRFIRDRHCWNCDVSLMWGAAVCLECARAIVVGVVSSVIGAILLRWLL